MLGTNGAVFVAAQFGSRFANSFLTTAVRYELLELGGVARFASAQVATQIARVLMQQVAGVLSDNLPLKTLYVLGEAVNLLLVAAAMIPAMYGFGGSALFFVNIGLGLTQAFSQPVSKSMPPAVVAAEDLAIVNSWDLTGDKIGRNLAPMVFTVVSSALGFRAAVVFVTALCLSIVALKQALVVADTPRRKTNGKTEEPGSPRKTPILAVAAQVWGGLQALRRDRTIALLISNTLLTNMLVYPLGSIVFPVIFKAIPEGAMEQEGSAVSRLLLGIQDLVGIHKAKAWMNYAALVSLGGVIGPFLSSAVVYGVQALSANHPEQVNWIGLNCGMTGQVFTLALLVVVLYLVQHLNAGACVFLLFVVWGAMTALNNVTTIYFNAHTQQRLDRSERGRFIANILTLFTLANSVGSLMYGYALASEGGLEVQISRSAGLLLVALALRLFILGALRLDIAGRDTMLLRHTEEKKRD